MADLVITGTSVVGDLTTVAVHLAGGTITAGQPIYSDTNNKWQVLDANNVPASIGDIAIALNGASLNQPVVGQLGGDVTIGAAVVAGTSYIVSATDPGGKIAPDADKAAGWTIIELGRAKSTTVIGLRIRNTGAVV